MISTVIRANAGFCAHREARTEGPARAFDRFQSPHIAALLFPLLDISYGLQGGVTRIFGRHSGGIPFLNLPFQVVAQLFIEFLLDDRTGNE
jgi:hypothetical protein